MSVFVAVNRTAYDYPHGVTVMRHPTCRMLRDGGRCDAPATKRVTYFLRRRFAWSLPWCPEHAALLKGMR